MSELPQDLMTTRPSQKRSGFADSARTAYAFGDESSTTQRKQKTTRQPVQAKPVKRKSNALANTMAFGALVFSLGAAVGSGYLYTEYKKFKAMGMDDMQARMSAFETRIEKTLSMDDSLSNLKAIVEELKIDMNKMNKDLAAFNSRSQDNNERIDSLTSAVVEIRRAVKQGARPNPTRQPKAPTRSTSTKAATPSSASTDKVTVLSVRSVGSMTVVRLGTAAGSQSPLLAEGDTWNGWQFVGVSNGKAKLVRFGKTYEVRL